MTPTLRKEIPADSPELRAGWVVLVVLRRPLSGDLRCYVGEMQRTSTLGLRITTVDWITGGFTGADFWFPWADIAAVEVYTEQHFLDHVDFGAKQTRYNRPSEASTRPAPAETDPRHG